jgi:hypothetical protein
MDLLTKFKANVMCLSDGQGSAMAITSPVKGVAFPCLALAVGLAIPTLFTSCVPSDPGGQKELPVDVTRTSNGWTLDVPVCGQQDGIIGFDLIRASDDDFNPRNSIEWRSSGVSRDRRVVELVLTDETMLSGDVNGGEIREILRGGTLDLPKMAFVVTTETGLAASIVDLESLTVDDPVVRLVGTHVSDDRLLGLLDYCDE